MCRYVTVPFLIPDKAQHISGLCAATYFLQSHWHLFKEAALSHKAPALTCHTS